MPSWRRVFTSEEARIESKAGASPPDARWPDVPLTQEQADRLDGIEYVDTSDFPMPVPPPYEADDEDKDESC